MTKGPTAKQTARPRQQPRRSPRAEPEMIEVALVVFQLPVLGEVDDVLISRR